MQIPLIEPTSTRYIHINPRTNRVHLLVPFVRGQDVSTDNTCRSTTELNAFFGGGGVSELEAYKSVLEFHISLLEKIDAIERSGLAYQQHGVSYQNPHYDMSFVLKNLNPDEFRQLQIMVGQNIAKINNATADNYATLAFTATEYEQLKKELVP